MGLSRPVFRHDPGFHRQVFRKYMIRTTARFPVLRFISAGLNRQKSFRKFLISLCFRFNLAVTRFIPEMLDYRFMDPAGARTFMPGRTNTLHIQWIYLKSALEKVKKSTAAAFYLSRSGAVIAHGKKVREFLRSPKNIRQKEFRFLSLKHPGISGHFPGLSVVPLSVPGKIYSGFPAGLPGTGRPVRQETSAYSLPEHPGISGRFPVIAPETVFPVMNILHRSKISAEFPMTVNRVPSGHTPGGLSQPAGDILKFPLKPRSVEPGSRNRADIQNNSSERPGQRFLPAHLSAGEFAISKSGLFRKILAKPAVPGHPRDRPRETFPDTIHRLNPVQVFPGVPKPENSTSEFSAPFQSWAERPDILQGPRSVPRENHILRQVPKTLPFANSRRLESLIDEVKKTVQEVKAAGEENLPVFRQTDGKLPLTGAEIHQISDQVLRMIDTRFVTERERRGLH